MVDKFGRLTPVPTELKKLAGTLSAIRDEKALRGWLRRLKDVAYDIDDLLDEDLAKNRKRSLADRDSRTTNWMEQTKNYTGSSYIKIHDQVHDLAQSTSGEECSSIDIANNRRDIYPMIRYSSFVDKKEAIPLILEILNKAKRLRTFYFVKSCNGVPIEEEDTMLKILETLFSRVKILRALYLRSYPIKELPISVSNLRHLRYLNLSWTDLETLPQSIRFLQNLQFLNLEGCKFLKELPDSIGNLSKLLTLNLESCVRFVSLPTSIGHLKSLQTLNLGYTEIEKLPESLCCLSDLRSINLQGCSSLLELPENMKDMTRLTNLHTGNCYKLTGMPSGIGRLSRLRELPLLVLSEKSDCGLTELSRLNLEGELCINKLENVKDFHQARNAHLKEKHGLESLELSWSLDTYKKEMEACERATDQAGRSGQDLFRALVLAENVLEGLQPHENLTELRIQGYWGRTFPQWLEQSLPNLAQLQLYSCFRCKTLPKISQLRNLMCLYLGKLPAVESLPPLGQLPSLIFLHLESLLAVKSLGSEFYAASDGAFLKLESLELNYMPQLEEWHDGPAGRQSFPRLLRLRPLDCPKLTVLPSSFPSVERLHLCADDELLLSSLPSGAFPNLKANHPPTCKDPQVKVIFTAKNWSPLLLSFSPVLLPRTFLHSSDI
ncbi:putative disease resistance RPP13-like protein 1 [Ananas comosus]|uniref:Putative disease resistance RPP13-like protein 1 n=1 Tax=Ananas comosus TaxID=4615 RepID=A0A199VGE5_ANACO|nr:putative disease resistance RPP13-like protein 1 [Ananas comosus]